MKKLFRTVLYAMVLSPLIILPFISEIVSLSVKNSIKISFETLIPSIFPFLFFSSLISHFMGDMLSDAISPFLMPLLGISKNACRSVIIGLLGGFPSGAADAADLYAKKKISKEEAERLPLFCNNAGLMFTVGAVGVSYLHSFKAGVILYIFHLFSSLIVALLTRKPKALSFPSDKKGCTMPSAKDFPAAFSFAVSKSVKALSVICANFMIFKVACDFLCSFFYENTAVSFLSGLIEVTGGVLSMPKTTEGLILISFLLAFNGLSVHMQTLSFFAPLGLSVKPLFIGSFIKAFLSAFLMYVSLPLNIFSGEKMPSMAFYIAAIALPLLFFLPLIKKRNSA